MLKGAPGGTATGLHNDAADNIYAVLEGQKNRIAAMPCDAVPCVRDVVFLE